MTEEQKPDLGPRLHQGPDHSAPYPVSRLATAFHNPNLAAVLARAELLLSARTGAKLRVIADQIKSLQQAALRVMEKTREAREEQALSQAQCAFKRIRRKTYHLYRKGGRSSLLLDAVVAGLGRAPAAWVRRLLPARGGLVLDAR